jgi:hypothetical protein
MGCGNSTEAETEVKYHEPASRAADDPDPYEEELDSEGEVLLAEMDHDKADEDNASIAGSPCDEPSDRARQSRLDEKNSKARKEHGINEDADQFVAPPEAPMSVKGVARVNKWVDRCLAEAEVDTALQRMYRPGSTLSATDSVGSSTLSHAASGGPAQFLTASNQPSSMSGNSHVPPPGLVPVDDGDSGDFNAESIDVDACSGVANARHSPVHYLLTPCTSSVSLRGSPGRSPGRTPRRRGSFGVAGSPVPSPTLSPSASAVALHATPEPLLIQFAATGDRQFHFAPVVPAVTPTAAAPLAWDQADPQPASRTGSEASAQNADVPSMYNSIVVEAEEAAPPNAAVPSRHNSIVIEAAQ